MKSDVREALRLVINGRQLVKDVTFPRRLCGKVVPFKSLLGIYIPSGSIVIPVDSEDVQRQDA